MRSAFRTMKLMAALLALSADAAFATPLGASDRFFDFSPGYQLNAGERLASVMGIFSFSDFIVPPTLIVDVFDEANGRGVLADSTTVIIEPGGLGFGAFFVPAATFDGALTAPGILDGRFSIGMREIAGHIDVQFVSVFAETTDGRFVELTPQAVPEPATLALLGVVALTSLFLRRPCRPTPLRGRR